MDELIESKTIENKLIRLNNKLVLLDKDVAVLYGIETKALNQNIKKNIELFPEEFRFQLTKNEYESLRSSEMTLKKGRGQHSKYLPYVFTEDENRLERVNSFTLLGLKPKLLCEMRTPMKAA
ncbi:MAG: ORF6N domain-containing protein [Campylobacterota bacterium]|nr:ORF6N domain-containing protein [Campylobacterota bacterium]